VIPAWLLAKQGGILRTAHLSQCPKCRAPILRGLDAERAALLATVDIKPIDEIGEVIALTQGRHTYDLVGSRDRKELEYRYEWNIKSKRRYPVHAAHKCGTPPLPAPPPPPAKYVLETADDRPPF
jgi:hypothetical protein